MSSDVTVTLAGFVGTTPKLFTSQAGNDYTSFRVAHTKRYLDRTRGEWVDGRTTWFTVKAWRGVARNVATSLRKGDAVVVTGRLAVDEWTGPEGPRTNLVVEATALGPDLSRGEARFRHTIHRREGDDEASESTGGSDSGEDGDASGADAADTDPWALADGCAEGDGDTGEGAEGPDAGDAGSTSATGQVPMVVA